MTVANVLSNMTTVLTTIWGLFSSVLGVVTGNPLIYASVLFALLGGLVMFTIGFVKRLGVRGISSAGRRRSRRK